MITEEQKKYALEKVVERLIKAVKEQIKLNEMSYNERYRGHAPI